MKASVYLKLAALSAVLLLYVCATGVAQSVTTYPRGAWTVTASSEKAGNEATNLIDASTSTFWSSQDGAALPHTLVFDMQSIKPVNRIYYSQQGVQDNDPTKGSLAFSDDNIAYGAEIPVAFNPTTGQMILTIPFQNHRYFRITITENRVTRDFPEDHNGSTALADVGAMYDSTLPATLTAFTVQATGTKVNLNWTTTSEQNSVSYKITRSVDGLNNFTTLGTVPAIANTTSATSYSFTDATPVNGTSFYRLELTSATGPVQKSPLAYAEYPAVVYSSNQPKNLTVFYFIPSDLAAPTDFKNRMDSIMLGLQTYFGNELQRNGRGYKTFNLVTDAAHQKVKLIVINGKLPKSGYPRDDSSPILAEVEAYIAANPSPFYSDHNLIMLPAYSIDYNPSPSSPDYDPDGIFLQGPFGGIGKNCYAMDYDQMKQSNLGKDTRDGRNSGKFIGGLAHEIGHGLNLDHNERKVSEEAALGTLLMEAGNYTYGKSKTSLSATDAAILNHNQVFNDGSLSYYGPTSSSIKSIHACYNPVKKAIIIAGRFTNTGAPVTDVAIYNDPANSTLAPGVGDNNDYDAVSWTAPVIGVDSFYIEEPIAELQVNDSSLYQMKVKLIQLDGNTTNFKFAYNFHDNLPDLTDPAFKPLSATITASAGNNGRISPAGATVVSCAANQAYTITANAGYVIESVLIDGVQSLTAQNSTVFSYTFVTVATSHTISATFKTAPSSLSLIVSASPTTILTTGTTTLSATVSGGITPYSYTFSGPGTIITTSNTASVSGLSAGVKTFTVVARDATTPTSQTISATVSVTVNTPAPTNTAPTVANAVSPQSATVGAAYTLSLANVFTDAQTPGQLTLTVSNLPAGLSFTAPSTISGTPSTTVGSPFTVTVKATDPGSLSASTTFALTVRPAPAVVRSLSITLSASPTTILTTGTTTLSATVSGGTSPYSYSFSGPGTITTVSVFNTASVSGLSAGVKTFTVVARDATTPTSQTISATVSVTVNTPAPTNTAPTVANAVSPQSATVGAAYTLSLANVFTDAQTPGQLTLTVSNLPAGLSFTAPSTISGTPSTTVGSPFTVTVKATDPGSLSASTTFTLTVRPAPAVVRSLSITLSASPTTILTTGTTTLSATVSGGTSPYSYSFSGPGTITTVSVFNTALVSGLSAGVKTFTVVARDATTPTSQTISATVSVTVNTPAPTNTAPTVANAVSPQSATVGTAYTLSLANVFTDAQTPGQLTLTVSNLPTGLSFTAPSTISGTPSTTVGSPFTVTVKATDPGSLSASTTFSIKVSPTASMTTAVPFSITSVITVNCTPVNNRVNLSFNPQYAGRNGQPIVFLVASELFLTTKPGPYSLTLNRDNPVIKLLALQNSTTSTFNYNWLAACNSLVAPGNTAPTVANAIPPRSATVGQWFSYVIPANTFTDAQTPNGLALAVSGLPAGLNFTAPATISGTPSKTVGSPFTVSVKATDLGNLSVVTTFTLTVSPANVVPFDISGVSQVSCKPISPGCYSLTINPKYSGLDGSPVRFSVVDELAATTAPGPYTLRLYADDPTITLKAVQSGVTGSFKYSWLASCKSNGRLGIDEPQLSVVVLGNPAPRGQVSIEVRGAAGQPLQVNLTNLSGQTISTYQLDQAGLVEQHTFELGAQPAGLLLLQATIPGQSQTVRVIKPE